jgi:2-polyprenyl-6-methoxyphenol hydroxylase-like FAD-dependent oxidoreductase
MCMALASGLNALRALFPNFERDLVQAGAVPLKAGLDVRVERPEFNPFPQRDLGWIGYSMSRPLLEHTVRRQLDGYRNIIVRQQCRAVNVLATSDGGRVQAVQCENRDRTSEVLNADMVIDASGRGSLTLALLKSTGKPRPEETVIGIDCHYTTALVAIPPTAPSDWKGVFTFPEAPASTCGALMLPIERRRAHPRRRRPAGHLREAPPENAGRPPQSCAGWDRTHDFNSVSSFSARVALTSVMGRLAGTLGDMKPLFSLFNYILIIACKACSLDRCG